MFTKARRLTVTAASVMLWMLFACQEPFPEDRHDLTDFRIVGMRLDDAPRAFLWSEAGLWHDPLPTSTWTDTSADGVTEWTLSTTDPAGHNETGRLTLTDGWQNPALVAFTRAEADSVWTLDVELDAAATTHFSAPAGTFDESGPQTTTFDPEGATGVLPVVALSFDGLGGARWDVLDLPLDVSPPWLAVGGRIFPTPLSDTTEGWWAVTLAEDSGWGGLAVTDAAPATGPEEGEALCGADPMVGFDPVWLTEARCARSEVVGHRVVMWGTGVLQ